MSERSVPLVLASITAEMQVYQEGKTNLSHDGLNPAHVPYWRVNNPTLWDFCVSMIGRADIEGSKSNVAMNAWLPQASYSCHKVPFLKFNVISDLSIRKEVYLSKRSLNKRDSNIITFVVTVRHQEPQA